MLRFLIVVALLAAVIYAFFWLLQRRGKGGGPQVIERGPVGPDDDEDFLRELEWRRHKEQRERDKLQPPAASDDAEAPRPDRDDRTDPRPDEHHG